MPFIHLLEPVQYESLQLINRMSSSIKPCFRILGFKIYIGILRQNESDFLYSEDSGVPSELLVVKGV